MRDNKLIISVKEARKILGKEAVKMSDDQITSLIIDLDFIARHAIKKFKKLNQSS